MMMFNPTTSLPGIPLLKSLLLLLLCSIAASGAYAQSPYSPLSEEIFQDALEHYRNFDYEKAAEVFSEVDEIPEAQLLLGNSLYALGRYREAVRILEAVLEAELLDVSQEARYTLGLTELSRRNYEDGLFHLQQLNSGRAFTPELQEQAEAQILNYARFFSYEQRIQLLESERMGEAPEVAFILLREGMRLHPATQIRELYTIAQRIQLPEARVRELRRILRNRLEEARMDGNAAAAEVEAEIEAEEQEEEQETQPEENDPGADDDATLQIPDLSVPDGFTYHIGVVLPQQEQNEQGYEVSRALYFGLLMAAEEYNQNQNSRRVQLHLVDFNPVAEVVSDTTEAESLEADNDEMTPADSALAAEPAFIRYTRQLLENQPLDMLFGPLFTTEAAELAELAKEHQIPLIAPLANSEDLTEDNAWVFHANPTFKVRGERMAEIATQYLGQRRISILVERGSLGETDALAFRNRAIELGAEIPYFFNENLQARQFDVRPFTRYFTSDVSLLNFSDEREEENFERNLKPTDALYVPLTGQPASTIFNLLMTQLRALRSDIQIIGSQELGSTDIIEAAAQRFRLVYSETFYRASENEEAFTKFEDSYQARFGSQAQSFSYIGYNTGRFMQEALERAANPQYTGTALRILPDYEGLGQHIHFDGGQINTALIPMRYGEEGYRPIFIPEEPIFNLIEDRAEELRQKLEDGESQN